MGNICFSTVQQLEKMYFMKLRINRREYYKTYYANKLSAEENCSSSNELIIDVSNSTRKIPKQRKKENKQENKEEEISN